MGQLGYGEAFDPRYAISYVQTGRSFNVKPSYLIGNSFLNGFSTQIGVYGADELLIKNNVLQGFIGPGKKI